MRKSSIVFLGIFAVFAIMILAGIFVLTTQEGKTEWSGSAWFLILFGGFMVLAMGLSYLGNRKQPERANYGGYGHKPFGPLDNKQRIPIWWDGF